MNAPLEPRPFVERTDGTDLVVDVDGSGVVIRVFRPGNRRLDIHVPAAHAAGAALRMYTAARASIARGGE